MDSTTIYGLLGLIHCAGFILLLDIVKLRLKKRISAMKLMGCYIIAFSIGLEIFAIYSLIIAPVSPAKELILKYPIEFIGATIGGVLGIGVSFLIVDFIILTIGRWIYKKK